MTAPGQRIRVMVVDDSAVIRKIISSTLLREEDLEVVGTAASGKEAIARFAELNPDVVTLDIEMPEMNGIEAVSHLRKLDPLVPIIMFSTLTESGGKATLDALSMGATDYVTKPSNSANIEASKEIITTTLVAKIRVLGAKKQSAKSSFSSSPFVSPTKRPTSNSTSLPLSGDKANSGGQSQAIVNHQVSSSPEPRTSSAGGAIAYRAPMARTKPPAVVVIGISTGGPNALSEVIPVLPANLGSPIVIVQHMPATFTRLLAERLDSKSRVKVREAIGGEILGPGEVYIAPGEHHLVINSNARGDLVLALDESPPVNSCRPAVDVLFRSAVKFGSRVTALVMTGMGQDGLIGAKELKAAGAEIVTQDEATSVVWGMPGYVTHAGIADHVLPLGSIAEFIIKRTSSIAMSSLSSVSAAKPLVGASSNPGPAQGEIGGQKWR